ncbi:MAG: type II restriction endonuclease subunit M [Gammaproteobacteria bacterium]|nr:MAG: type II restriction endonuclease subunit M [Gammaproteobacteria bacterium]
MTVFLRLLEEKDKEPSLRSAVTAYRSDASHALIFQIAPEKFQLVPMSPFSYWVGERVLETFARLPAFNSEDRTARDTNPQGDDKRFIRSWWEVSGTTRNDLKWVPLCKGGKFSPIYSDVHLVVAWNPIRMTYLGFQGTSHRPLEKPASLDFFFRPGLTWPRRSQIGLGLRCMPRGCIFAQKGPGAFIAGDDPTELLAYLAIGVSTPYIRLAQLQMAFGAYEVGVIQRTPVPKMSSVAKTELAILCRRAWSLKREIDSSDETSHAFVLPIALRQRVSAYDPAEMETELARIQLHINDRAFELYEFDEADRNALMGEVGGGEEPDSEDDDEDEGIEAPVPVTDALLSWANGVAFGRFDWRLATGERSAPVEPEPFDPLPPKSPGMLPDGAEPFHAHAGILVDDQGHPHDLARLIEEVLARVEAPVPDDVQRWLQRDFFAFHLQRYSKSRRKAPIYWPLSTTSGSYTLWVYYPSLTSQTLYTAINDFIEPKLNQVGPDVTALRNKGSARTRDDEKQFEALQAFDLELRELRDTLLNLAPTYKPNHDDGVQISAARLWPLFRHKPWQKVLKDTWTKLEKGDYDWAHLAMNYWPERVREKCKTDKSLAIAHGLENLYIEPEAKAKKARGKKKAGGDE